MFQDNNERKQRFLACRIDNFAGLELAFTSHTFDAFVTLDALRLNVGDGYRLFSTDEGVDMAKELMAYNRVATFNYMFPSGDDRANFILDRTEYLTFFIENTFFTQWTPNSFPPGEFYYFSSPLHAAASDNNRIAIEILINGGANVDIENEYGCTPLHLAAKECNFEAVQCLVEYEADILKVNKGGFKALDLAGRSISFKGYDQVQQLPCFKQVVTFLKAHEKTLIMWDLWELTPKFVSYLQQLPLERIESVISFINVKK